MEVVLVEKTKQKMKQKKQKHNHSILNFIREERFNNRYSLTDRKEHYDALNDPYTSYYFSNPSVKGHLKRFQKAIREQPNETEKNRINKLLTLRIKEKFKDFICPKTLVYEQEMSNLELAILGKQSSASLTKMKSKQSLASNTTAEHNLPLRKKKYFADREGFNSVLSQQVETQLTTQQPSSQKNQIDQDEGRHSFKKDKSFKHSPKKIAILNKRKKQESSSTHLPEVETSISNQERLKTDKEGNDQKVFADKLAEDLHKKKHDKWLKFLEEKKKLLSKMKQTEPEHFQRDSNQ